MKKRYVPFEQFRNPETRWRLMSALLVIFLLVLGIYLAFAPINFPPADTTY